MKTSNASPEKPATRQGYLVIAFGRDRYFQLAANLAASIRIHDPLRPICLLSDRVPPRDIARFFTDFVELPPDERYPHLMSKLRVFDLTPFDQTMFVDADCIMMKDDADEIWDRATTRAFSITGHKCSSGTWKGLDIATMLKSTGASYLIRMNSGVFYFDKSPAARAFFDAVNELYLTSGDAFANAHLWGGSGQTDEPYLGLIMGKMGMDTDNMANIGRNSWSVSTWRTFHCTNAGLVYKATGFLYEKSYLPTRIAVLSPTFLHFVGLKPKRLYARLVRRVMSHPVNIADGAEARGGDPPSRP